MNAHAEVEKIYRRDARQVFATLVRLLGDFDRAEEALQELLKLIAGKFGEAE